MKYPIEGGCDCGEVRYRLTTAPMFVNCCHCRWCQRGSGSAFAINAIIETDRVERLKGEPEMVGTPTASGKGQQIARCPRCRIALWSHYAGGGPTLSFIRVGSLDEPDQLPPDIHVFTSTRQPWVRLPESVPAVEAYYDRHQHWPATSIARLEALFAQSAAT